MLPTFSVKIAKVCSIALGPRYTKPGLQEKNQAHQKYKKNIAMRTVCLYCNQLEGSKSSLYSVFMVSSVFFRLQSRLGSTTTSGDRLREIIHNVISCLVRGSLVSRVCHFCSGGPGFNPHSLQVGSVST